MCVYISALKIQWQPQCFCCWVTALSSLFEVIDTERKGEREWLVSFFVVRGG